MITYLYIKQHRVTKLKYFGVTRSNPFTYRGSGTYWRRHLKQHGNYVDTTEIYGFDNLEMCSKFALSFSEENKIINSKNWANLKEEDGFGSGHRYSVESRTKMSAAAIGKPKPIRTQSHCDNIRKSKLGHEVSVEVRDKIRKKLTGRRGFKHSEETKEKVRQARLAYWVTRRASET